MNQDAQKELSKAKYWDERYLCEKVETQGQQDKNYEWLQTFDKLRPFLTKHLPPTSEKPRILHLGCGTSTLSADLHSLGYNNQLNIDFSPIAIQAMQEKYQGLPLEWQIMDVRNMSLSDKSIDFAFDKSTLDAMLYGSLWDPEDDIKENVGLYVNEVARVLKPGGRWLYITFRQPHFLKPLLNRPNIWNMRVDVLEGAPGSFEYFAFILDKYKT